jgi:mannosylfructose-phosphate synthase
MLSTHGYFDPAPELGKTDTGGQVLYVLQLARSLAEMGVKTDIYTRWFDRSKPQIDPLPGCPDARVIRIPAGDWEFIPKERIYEVLDVLAANMTEFIRENGLDYDLYHGHYVDAGIVCLDVAEALSKPAFFTAHSLGAWKRQRIGGDPAEMDATFNFTKRVAEELRIFQSVVAQSATSTEEIEKIEELYGFKSPRIEFIPPGVDVHEFRPLKQDEEEIDTRVPLPKHYIFMVSRIAQPKGHDLLLPAFARIAEDFPDLHLLIAGGSAKPDEEERGIFEHIETFGSENGLSDRIHPIGGVAHDDLPPYFRGAELFVLPARYEPFGMTALEAMSCRAPAVVSRFAGIEENLSSGQDCLLVDPHDTAGFASALASLLSDPGLTDRIAGKGRETVMERFSWEAIAARYIEFYDKYI